MSMVVYLTKGMVQGRQVGQIAEGLFSAVPTPMFVSKHM